MNKKEEGKVYFRCQRCDVDKKVGTNLFCDKCKEARKVFGTYNSYKRNR